MKASRAPDGVDLAFRVFRQHRAHFIGGIALYVGGDRADRFQLVNARMLFQQLLIGGPAAFHRREAGYPEFDDVGRPLKSFTSWPKEALASEASSCCETVTPGTLPLTSVSKAATAMPAAAMRLTNSVE